MITTLLLALSVGIVSALLLLIFVLPTKVQYIETIEVAAPASSVYDAIRYQTQLMEWSAWPGETKSECTVRQQDGQVGAQTVYLQNGKETGHQEVTGLVENEQVSFFLTSNQAPFEQDTRMHFFLHKAGTNKTRVSLWFDNTLKRPSHLIPYLFGIVRWTHRMHRKDLVGLKQYVEKAGHALPVPGLSDPLVR